jgi:hypothetical protein
MMSQRSMPDAESHLRHRRGQHQPLSRSPGQPEHQIQSSRLKEAEYRFHLEFSLVKVLGLSSSHNSHRTSHCNNRTSRNSHRDRNSSNNLREVRIGALPSRSSSYRAGGACPETPASRARIVGD